MREGIKVEGSCHCGAVRFEVQIPEQPTITSCNCSICSKTGFIHLIVPAGNFNLRAGKDRLNEYRFNTGQARHLFCSLCGVKSFYIPRSHPDGISVNYNCLALPDGMEFRYESFDGANWEKNVHTLRRQSLERLTRILHKAASDLNIIY